MLKMSSMSLKTSIHTFHNVFVQIFEDFFLASASISLQSVMFKILQASWVIAVDSFFNLSATLIVTVNPFFNGPLTTDYINCTQIIPTNAAATQ
jgi:hypothetical protein